MVKAACAHDQLYVDLQISMIGRFFERLSQAQTKAKTQKQLRRAAATKQDASATTPAKLGVVGAPGGGAVAAAAPPGGGCGAVAVVRRRLTPWPFASHGRGARVHWPPRAAAAAPRLPPVRGAGATDTAAAAVPWPPSDSAGPHDGRRVPLPRHRGCTAVAAAVTPLFTPLHSCKAAAARPGGVRGTSKGRWGGDAAADSHTASGRVRVPRPGPPNATRGAAAARFGQARVARPSLLGRLCSSRRPKDTRSLDALQWVLRKGLRRIALTGSNRTSLYALTAPSRALAPPPVTCTVAGVSLRAVAWPWDLDCSCKCQSLVLRITYRSLGIPSDVTLPPPLPLAPPARAPRRSPPPSLPPASPTFTPSSL